MALESGTKISQLVQDNPPGTDQVAQGDDHIRLIKGVLKASFPSDVAVQIPDIAGHKGEALIVSEDETSIEWGTSAVATLKVDWHPLGNTSERFLTEWTTIYTPMVVDPISATSSLVYEITGACSVAGYADINILDLRLWDTTNDVAVGPEFFAGGFRHSSDSNNFETISGISSRFLDDAHAAGPFTIVLQALHDDVGEAGSNINNCVISITEIE